MCKLSSKNVNTSKSKKNKIKIVFVIKNCQPEETALQGGPQHHNGFLF